MLLVAFAMQTFQKSLIVIGYYANTTAFAKNCENKARPVIKCHGKCQMMKKLKAEEKKEAQSPERKSENKTEVLFSSQHTILISQLTFEERLTEYQLFQLHPTSKPYTDIFHPPSCI
jgi:hypothetical protein